ncbi:FAD/NAD(P)-binding domain-containing protein [Lophiostoma macrostomum CBS 122681]|uniref:FAD/NAD(P)-binding domain-containing protein n=1 Tax=Lophiostoma macrostomum CBS 122681 TaxID=1314788 RepID=A0A6A6TMB6_9PLEO|nr:FAD/NAD(P)-binding domain-containing protein [Lophiostoma macrostomum CBS 122681]
MSSHDTISHIAIIGAGVSGLVAAKYLLAEDSFTSIDVYEQRDSVGGLWNYTPDTEEDFLLTTTATTTDKTTAFVPKCGSKPFNSPIYEDLEANIPRMLMQYSDLPFPADQQLFPSHRQVLGYIQAYALTIKQEIKLGVQKIRLKQLEFGPNKWEVESIDLSNGVSSRLVYDAVIIASGHHSLEYIPRIRGIDEWRHAHPGSIIHSKDFRRAAKYEIMNVLPEITRVSAEHRSIELADSTILTGVDGIIFCTGYLHDLPFLSPLNPHLISNGRGVEQIYQHMFYAPNPTLSFVGLPRIVSFSVCEAQAAVIARVYSGRLKLSSIETMQQWNRDMIITRGDAHKTHTFRHPDDVIYVNSLISWASTATPNPRLGNGGQGKLLPHWGPLECTYRRRSAAIRAAFRSHGPNRHLIRPLADLRFPDDSGSI